MDAARHNGASLFCSVASGSVHRDCAKDSPRTARVKIFAISRPLARRSHPTALRLARAPMARNESSSSSSPPPPRRAPSHPARRYPSTAFAIESIEFFSSVQSAGTNSPPVSLSKAQHPTESPLCTQLGAPNAAASTTVMPYASYAHGWTFSTVRRYSRSIPRASRKSRHTRPRPFVTSRNRDRTDSAYAPAVDAHKTGTISRRLLVPPPSDRAGSSPPRTTPLRTSSAHRLTNRSGSFSGDRRTQHVSRNRASCPGTASSRHGATLSR
mmetsp:Transcript_2713/g.11611  ORF Transcript_2713/g.11611 Transcript_2713/m.11611 type:complete len:269 (-) Transcript_2713:779-1585(-)